jgi:hypothetical protein
MAGSRGGGGGRVVKYVCFCRVRRLDYEVYEYALPGSPDDPICYDRKSELQAKFGPLAEVECELERFE